jgi:hypothetical protein
MRLGLMPYSAVGRPPPVAVLHPDDGAPGHVEPDLALLLQLPPVW